MIKKLIFNKSKCSQHLFSFTANPIPAKKYARFLIVVIFAELNNFVFILSASLIKVILYVCYCYAYDIKC